MSIIIVKHVKSRDDWKNPKDGTDYWIDYWVKHSSYKLQNFCRDCGQSISDNNPFVGAHVKKVDSDDASIYIVPTCKKCNTKGASDYHKFECDERILVPANKNELKDEQE